VDRSEERSWNFQAGDLALDFANTADWHASQEPVELLKSYADLVKWAFDFGLLNELEAHSLTTQAREYPGEAAETLSRALDMRETIYRIFSTVARGGIPAEEDLERLKETLVQALSAGRLIPQEEGFGWDWKDRQHSIELLAFERMLWPIVQAAVDLLLSKNLSRVGQCADDRGCGLLFIDTSRNQSRQWCSMDTCGNRAKAQRYYNRAKST
jgi:predicted RNA-binding Zn ribbon-like protein